ncbi:EF-hand domain-containing protein [Comamonas composti]|uniref:EF-hand domain-containing protein n=1 Tax=Comamonas composti TaxID=408558 RepID=UPI00040E21C5|nr:EF-hand domain-containing protein [Comamonas composti]
MDFPKINRDINRPPLLRAAMAVLLVSAFTLPMAHAEPDTTAAEPAALSKGEIKARREFQMLDANQDGKLSRHEVALFPPLAAAFDEADTDKDGFVSMEEVKAFAVKYRAERAAAKAAATARDAGH